jgi:hypothetical protein
VSGAVGSPEHETIGRAAGGGGSGVGERGAGGRDSRSAGRGEVDGVRVWVEESGHEVRVGRCCEFGAGADSGYWADSGDGEVFRRTMWGYASHRGWGNLE